MKKAEEQRGECSVLVEDYEPGNYLITLYAGDNGERVLDTEVVQKKQDANYLLNDYALFASEKNITINCCQAEINRKIYSNEDFCFNGSILNANDSVETAGVVNANGWIINMKEKIEQAEKHVMKNYSSDIISDIKEKGESYSQLDIYNSSDITMPTFSQGTTGAYCTKMNIKESLISEGSVWLNCNEAEIGTESGGAILCSLNGDITINATKINAYGLIYAPNGTVSINVSECNLEGTIIAKEIKLSGSYFNINK